MRGQIAYQEYRGTLQELLYAVCFNKKIQFSRHCIYLQKFILFVLIMIFLKKKYFRLFKNNLENDLFN